MPIVFDHADRSDRMLENQDRLMRQRAERQQLQLGDQALRLNERSADLSERRFDLQERIGNARLGQISRDNQQDDADRTFLAESLTQYGYDPAEAAEMSSMSAGALGELVDQAQYEQLLGRAQGELGQMVDLAFQPDPGADPNSPETQALMQRAQAVREQLGGVVTLEDAARVRDELTQVIYAREQAKAEQAARVETLGQVQALMGSGLLKGVDAAAVSTAMQLYERGLIDEKQLMKPLLAGGSGGGTQRPTAERLAFLEQFYDPALRDLREGMIGDAEAVAQIEKGMAATGQPAPRGFDQMRDRVRARGMQDAAMQIIGDRFDQIVGRVGRVKDRGEKIRVAAQMVDRVMEMQDRAVTPEQRAELIQAVVNYRE